MKRCNGEYAKNLSKKDRYYWCEDCTDCKLSEELPAWRYNADPETDIWEGDDLM